MKKNILLLGILAVGAMGCSLYNVDSKDLTENFYPPKTDANDVVFLDTVEEAHQVIAQITVTTERNQRMEDVIQKMKREAAILGGDAITNVRTDATGEWKKLPAQNLVGNAYLRARFTADVIVFESGSTAADTSL